MAVVPTGFANSSRPTQARERKSRESALRFRRGVFLPIRRSAAVSISDRMWIVVSRGGIDVSSDAQLQWFSDYGEAVDELKRRGAATHST